MIFKFLFELGAEVLKDVQVIFHRDQLMEISELEQPEAESVNCPNLAFDLIFSFPLLLALIYEVFLSENSFDRIYKLSGGVGHNGVSFSSGWCFLVVRILFLGTGLYLLGLNFSKVVLSPGSSGLIFRD